MSNLADFKKKMKAHQKEAEKLQEEGRKCVLEALKEVFDANPDLESVGWTQYTPYFNDGDACYFGVNAYPEEIRINNVSGYDEDEEDGGDDAEELTFNADKVRKVVSDIVESVPSDVLEGWGEGEIIIDRNLNVVCEDYEHD